MKRHVTALVGVPAPKPFTFRGRRFSFDPSDGVAGDLDWYAALLANQIAPSSLSLNVFDQAASTTAANLLTSLRRLASSVKSGDTFVLVLVGHGFQVPDDNGEEQDGCDEVFAASDGPVTDDHFAAVWQSMPADSSVVVFADTCSSDSLGILGGGPPNVIVTTGTPGPSRLSIAASQSYEKAGTTRFGARGVMSLALEDAWADPASHGSYEQWFLAAAELVSVRRPHQHPVLRYLGPDRLLLDSQPFRNVD